MYNFGFNSEIMKIRCFSIFVGLILISFGGYSQLNSFTKQDSLRGNTGGYRAWWNVTKYDLEVTPNLQNHTISGLVKIKFDVLKDTTFPIQIDLQEPMNIEFVQFQGKNVSFYREGNVYWIDVKNKKKKDNLLTLYFKGKPREAVNPPWDGGWIWAEDEQGKPFVSVACQGLGASAWFPCKDTQSDEPEDGSTLTIAVPDSLVAVSNGKLKQKSNLFSSGITKYQWEVSSPINSYNIIPYIGNYISFSDTFQGLDGTLHLSYYVLKGNEEKAKKQFKDVKKMLRAFEYWFGPYPFYEDGYKLVEAPHLGMEHQSAIAYGNQFKNGYLGTDLSGTGHGLFWDFIIVHESGHEWFGNSITSKDIADMWIHESFTTYSEILFLEYWKDKKTANAYIQGLRKKISNDKPMIGPYGVNAEGSGDMYNKGGNMIHTMRLIINNDSIFREMLLGLQSTFKHKTVRTAEIEDFISKKSKIDFSKFFDQYLRTIQIPILNANISKENTLNYSWKNTVENYNVPVKITLNGKNEIWIKPKADLQVLKWNEPIVTLEIDPNYYANLELSRD